MTPRVEDEVDGGRRVLGDDGCAQDGRRELVADGVTPTSELTIALQAVAPPAQHIYSRGRVTVLAVLDPSPNGALIVSPYTR